MTLHMPVEFLHSVRQNETVEKDYPNPADQNQLGDIEVAAPGYSLPGAAINVSWNLPSAAWDVASGSADVLAELPGVDEVPWLGLFLTAAGMTIDQLAPVANSQAVGFDDCLNEAGDIFPDEALYPFATTDHRMFICYPCMVVDDVRHYTLQDTWGLTGFIGEKTIITDTFGRVGGFYGEYRYWDPAQHALPPLR